MKSHNPNTPWRFGDLRTARKPVHICKPVPPPELDLSSITEAIAQARVISEPKKCMRGCGTILRASNSGQLCSVCERRKQKTPAKLKEMDNCACGRPLNASGAKLCRRCIERERERRRMAAVVDSAEYFRARLEAAA